MPSCAALLTQRPSSLDPWINKLENIVIIVFLPFQDAHELAKFRELDRIGWPDLRASQSVRDRFQVLARFNQFQAIAINRLDTLSLHGNTACMSATC